MKCNICSLYICVEDMNEEPNPPAMLGRME